MNGIKILPTAYLPPINYFSILAKEEKILIETKETYPKQTYRNRCEILTGNGIMNLCVHTSKPNGNHSTTDTIIPSYSEPWHIQHWRAIQAAYSASPYFMFYSDTFRVILEKKHSTLLELNNTLLVETLKILKIDTKIEFSKTYRKDYAVEEDYRAKFSPKNKTELLACKAYHQVFEDRFPFQPNLSIIDLLFNIGPDSKHYLLSI